MVGRKVWSVSLGLVDENKIRNKIMYAIDWSIIMYGEIRVWCTGGGTFFLISILLRILILITTPIVSPTNCWAGNIQVAGYYNARGGLVLNREM